MNDNDNNKVTLQDVLEAVNTGFSNMEKRMDARFNGLEARMDRLEQRMDKLEQRMDKLEQRMDRLERIIDSWPPPSTIDDLMIFVGKLRKRIDFLEQKTGFKADI